MLKKRIKKTKLYKNKEAFTLIEVLIAIAVIGFAATAYLNMLVQLDKRSTQFEIEDTAQTIAIQTINEIRSKRIGINEWDTLSSLAPGMYKYNNGFVGEPKNLQLISDYGEFKTFCISNSQTCSYTDSNLFRSNLTYSDVFSRTVSIQNISGKDSKLITVYVGCKNTMGCDTFVKMSTVVYRY